MRRHMDFEVKDHLQLGATLGLMDFEAGSTVSGTKFTYLRGAGALLEVGVETCEIIVKPQPKACMHIFRSVPCRLPDDAAGSPACAASAPCSGRVSHETRRW